MLQRSVAGRRAAGVGAAMPWTPSLGRHRYLAGYLSCHTCRPRNPARRRLNSGWPPGSAISKMVSSVAAKLRIVRILVPETLRCHTHHYCALNPVQHPDQM